MVEEEMTLSEFAQFFLFQRFSSFPSFSVEPTHSGMCCADERTLFVPFAFASLLLLYFFLVSLLRALYSFIGWCGYVPPVPVVS